MVYSATSASAVVGGANPMSYLERQGTFAVLGVVGLIVASRWKYTRLRPLAPTLVAVALIACAAVLVVAHPVNGARRWVSFGPLTVQPSELAKLAFTVWLAAPLARGPPRVPASGAAEPRFHRGAGGPPPPPQAAGVAQGARAADRAAARRVPA